MSDLIKWPFARKEYPGLENPRYVSDIVAANQATIAALKAIAGLNDTDFRIISGLDYVLGIPNTFSPGIFYLNGLFFFIDTAFTEGNFLGSGATEIMSKPFGDGVSRNIYYSYPGAVSAIGGVGFSPAMTGNMNDYRIGNKYLADKLLTALAELATLGTAAFANIGTGAGQVMAADDARFLNIYNNVLTLNNTGVFVPANPYEPATKKYVDDALGFKVVAHGHQHVGDLGSGTLTVTIALGTTLASAAYTPVITVISDDNNVPAGNDSTVLYAIGNKTTTSFDVYFRETNPATQNISVDWVVFQ